ncbi:hypothetical protein P3W43_01395 [Salinicola salarius]|uniref:hypothetical protein n=1 Tax=Salinicola salarius TaxID=430457 RepID=UPI0023E3B858|nr:hypothetical protein [Salinicola salarius]MDF3917503.1 hypothetical protein [Salinicola salarius]
MNWSDIGDIVGKAAPAVGSALYGSAGGAIGTALASLLGTEATPEAVGDALKRNPELALKAQELEAEMRKAALADRSDARGLQKAALAAGRGEFQNWLASGVILAGFLLFAAILFAPEGTVDPQVRTWAFPFIQALITTVIGYYFGSTNWSNKNAKIAPDGPSLYGRIDTGR